MNEFCIDIKGLAENDLESSRMFIYGQKLVRDIRRKFYNIKEKQLTLLSDIYSIDYVIMNKRYHKNRFEAFTVVYENECYVLYRI